MFPSKITKAKYIILDKYLILDLQVDIIMIRVHFSNCVQTNQSITKGSNVDFKTETNFETKAYQTPLSTANYLFGTTKTDSLKIQTNTKPSLKIDIHNQHSSTCTCRLVSVNKTIARYMLTRTRWLSESFVLLQ